MLTLDTVELRVESLAKEGLAVRLDDARPPQLVGQEEEDEDAAAQKDPAQYAGDEAPSHVSDTTHACPAAIGIAGYTRLVQVLFVCTANMCRSPMAAALFGRLAQVGGDDAPEEVSVVSAGLLPGGYASPPEVVAAMAELGSDLSGHASTQITAEMVAISDVVVGMARRHAREVVLLDVGAFGRTFTLKELVRRGDLVGQRQPDEALAAWLDRLHEGRHRTDLVGSSADDDVADPLGGPLDAYRQTARELGNLVERVAALLWAPREIPTLPG